MVKKLFIHPQAAPLVARHAIDCLNMLSKVFPADFVQPQQLVASTNKKSKELNGALFIIFNYQIKKLSKVVILVFIAKYLTRNLMVSV